MGKPPNTAPRKNALTPEVERRQITGVVKWFNDVKGFGFITPDTGGDDVFVHYTGIAGNDRRKSLNDDDKVSFTVVQGEKGLQANDVVRL